MRRIAVINQKGGVGKTTTTANLGAALAIQGRRVVVVDMDAQANLSLSLGVEARADSPTSYTVLMGSATIAQALRPTSLPNLSLVASHLDLSGAELELAGAMGREYLLRDALREWESVHRAEHGRAPADYVLFDCPPSLGLLSINALAASGEVLITLQTEFLALQGMSKLVEVTQLLKRRLNPDLEISAILPCLYDSRLKLAREVLGEIRRYFPGLVLERPIRSSVKLAEAPSFAQTIFEYADDSHAADDYRAAARAVIARETRDTDLAGLPEFDATKRLARAPSARVPPPPRAKAPATAAMTPPPASSVSATRDEVSRASQPARPAPQPTTARATRAKVTTSAPSGAVEAAHRDVRKESRPTRPAQQPKAVRASAPATTKSVHTDAVSTAHVHASKESRPARTVPQPPAVQASSKPEPARAKAARAKSAPSVERATNGSPARAAARTKATAARPLDSSAAKARNGVDTSIERAPARTDLAAPRRKSVPSLAADAAGADAARAHVAAPRKPVRRARDARPPSLARASSADDFPVDDLPPDAFEILSRGS